MHLHCILFKFSVKLVIWLLCITNINKFLCVFGHFFELLVIYLIIIGDPDVIIKTVSFSTTFTCCYLLNVTSEHPETHLAEESLRDTIFVTEYLQQFISEEGKIEDHKSGGTQRNSAGVYPAVVKRFSNTQNGRLLYIIIICWQVFCSAVANIHGRGFHYQNKHRRICKGRRW